MMRPFLLLLLARLAFDCSAQFKIYTTIEDLVNKTSIDYPDHDLRSLKGMSDTKLIIRHPVTKDEVEIDCTRIWGFMFKGELFRVMKQGKYYTGSRNNFPVILSRMEGEVFYWFNGAFLQELKWDRSFAALDRKMPGFVSYGPDGDAMATCMEGSGPSWMQEGGDGFFRDHSDLQWLQDCLRETRRKGYVHSVISTCIGTRAEQRPDEQ